MEAGVPYLQHFDGDVRGVVQLASLLYILAFGHFVFDQLVVSVGMEKEERKCQGIHDVCSILVRGI